MSLPQNAIRMYVNLDGTKNRTAEGAIQGFGNGATVYQLLAPIATFPTLSVSVTYELFDGDKIGDTLRFVGEIEIENPVGSGLFETWNLWEKGLTQEVTGNATSQGQDLQIQSFFIDTTEEEVTVDTVPTYTETFTVGKSITPLVIRFDPGNAASFQAQIDNKRDRDNSSLVVQEAGIPDDFSYTGFDPASGSEKRLSQVTLKNDILAGADIAESFATFADSGINNPNLAGNFTIRVNQPFNSLEPDYNDTAQLLAVDPIPTIDTVVAGSITRPGDLPAGTFTNLNIDNFISVMKTVGFPDFIFRTEYFVRNAGVINPVAVLVGTENTVSSTTISQIQNTDTIPTVTLAVGDEIIFQTVVRSSTGVASKGTAQFMGVPRTTWSRFRFEAGTISSGKMNKLLVSEVDNLVKQIAGGDVIDAGISVDDVLLADLEETISAAWTFNAKTVFGDDVDIDLDLLVSGNVTITGDLIVNGTQTILNVTTLEVEDNIMTLAKGQASNLVDIGLLGDLGVDGSLFIGYRQAANLFKFGFAGDERRFASIIDTPNIDEIFVYDSVTGNLITKTALEIKTLLSLENVDNTSDLNKPISNATQTALDDKLTGMAITGGATNLIDIKKIILTGGFGLIQSAPNEATIDIVGQGTGEGQIILGQVDVTPIIGVDISNEIMALTIQSVQSTEDGQSTDLTVFELFDQNDAPANTQRIFKTSSEQEENQLEYKYNLQGIATNSNQVEAVDLIFSLVVDTVLIWERTKTISEASVQAPLSTNNFSIEEYFRTDILEADQDAQLFVRASAAGVNLDQMEIHYTSNFVQGEAISGLMRSTTFATNGTNRVDRALIADGVAVYDTTNPQLADQVTNDITDMIAGNKYTFNVTGTMDGSQITWSKDNQANSYSVFEEDGTTPAIGTDYNLIPKLTADFDGVKLSIVSLDKQLDDVEARATVNEGNISTNTTNIGTNTSNISINTQQRAIQGGGELINSTFPINQRGVSGTVILLAGEYGHDRWRAGSGGATYTFATLLNVITITISVGTLEQEIEGVNLQSSGYILSWSGTAQGQIDGGGFAVSPVTATLVGGTNSTVEFDTGTLIIPKLELGSVATNFISNKVSNELIDSKWYTKRLGIGYNTGARLLGGIATSTSTVSITDSGLVEGMRDVSGSVSFANIVLNDGSSSFTITDITLSTDGALIVSSSGLTQGTYYQVRIDSNDIGFLQIDMEL